MNASSNIMPTQVGTLITEEDTIADVKSLVNELVFQYDSDSVGIRDIIDGLNTISDNIEFMVINSLDQSSATQLKLLSKSQRYQLLEENFHSKSFIWDPSIIFKSY